ncbi:hypothetical protein L6452_11115 [Arctium lappa]|uniref:Uncharacterized protein n=1 Tax=Arctium lappa TaxID=4217 RepID=A0ACB9DNR1_ARCLA|nr:hypothetical protein L6452_11115 [Arctium lappa]
MEVGLSSVRNPRIVEDARSRVRAEPGETECVEKVGYPPNWKEEINSETSRDFLPFNFNPTTTATFPLSCPNSLFFPFLFHTPSTLLLISFFTPNSLFQITKLSNCKGASGLEVL